MPYRHLYDYKELATWVCTISTMGVDMIAGVYR